MSEWSTGQIIKVAQWQLVNIQSIIYVKMFIMLSCSPLNFLAFCDEGSLETYFETKLLVFLKQRSGRFENENCEENLGQHKIQANESFPLSSTPIASEVVWGKVPNCFDSKFCLS